MLRYHNRRVLVTKEVTFDSAHSLKDYEGACSRTHGHTYRLIIGLSGHTAENGILVDFKVVKKFLQEVILERLDHQDLNEVLSDFNTTAENMVVWIFDRLVKVLEVNDSRKIQVEFVRLFETPTSYAEYRRDW